MSKFVQGPVIPNLKWAVTSEDYAVHSGPDWPAYEDYVNGYVPVDPAMLQEVREFTDNFLKQGVKFPIKTESACQSKWAWSTIFLNKNSTASCHRVLPTKFDLEDFDNFHNTPQKLEHRRKMLRGEWPGEGCEYCRDTERSGGWSDRLHNLDIRGLTPPELLADPTAINVSPTIVEIFAQNTCNFSCTYCFPDLSSKIEEENRKFGTFNQNGVVIKEIDPTNVPVTEEYFVKFISWLERNVHKLQRLHLLGGETFLQTRLMDSVLTVLESKPNPELQLCIFSNMNAPDKLWDRYIERVRMLQLSGYIRVFDLTASLDCWGAQSEYVRYGLDLAKFEERMAWAAEQGNWLRFNINQTITALTIKTMPDLIRKIDYYSKHKHIGHYFEMYIGDQQFQHPKNFAYSQWSGDFDAIIAAMPTRTVEQQEAVPRMQGVQKFLEQYTQNNEKEIARLRVFLDELDRRRNTNWRELFSFINET